MNEMNLAGFSAIDASEMELIDGGWRFDLSLRVGGFRLEIHARG